MLAPSPEKSERWKRILAHRMSDIRSSGLLLRKMTTEPRFADRSFLLS
jgi:hypothetical protein